MITLFLSNFFAAIGAVIILLAIYYYYQYLRTYVYLKTIPCIPQVPIIGSAHLVSTTTEVFYQKLLNFPMEFGRTFWAMIGPTSMCLTSEPELLEIILSSNKHINKPRQYKVIADIGVGNGLITSNGDDWRSQRKHITPTFHFKILEQYMKIFNRNSEEFVSSLEEEVTKDYTDIYHQTPLWALKQVTETVLGLQPSDNTENNHMYLNNIKKLLKIAIERWLRPLEYVDFIFPLFKNYRQLKISTKQIYDYVLEKVIKQKEEENAVKPSGKVKLTKQTTTTLDLLIESSKTGNKLGETELVEQVQTILFTGFDTIAANTACVLYNLAENPEVQEKLYQEVRNVLDNDISKEITIPHLHEMKYLEMVLKESMRICTHVPVVARKITGDIKWGSVTLSKDLTIVANITALHRDPEIYPDPEKFIPERFNPENIRTRHAFSYISFSAGPRNCIGQKYGTLAIKVGLAKLLLAYEFISVGHTPIFAAEIALVPKNGIRVAIRKRKC